MATNIINSINLKKKINFQTLFPTASPGKLLKFNFIKDALDFIKRCLIFSPENRLTIEEALAHPYVKKYHN
jgi:serine/threonine protein kinase